MMPMSTNLIVRRDARPLWCREVPIGTRAPIVGGLAVLAFSVLGFGTWASLAPIEGAVVAPGVFVATDQNKIIQHLEGGIIRELKVREGTLVDAGETLIVLDDTQPKADLRRLQLRYALLRATAGRLKSEAEQLEKPDLPTDLMTSADPEVQLAVQSQSAIFLARRQKLLTEVAIQNQAIASFQHRIRSELARLESARAQHALIEEELKDKKRLLELGLLRRPEYFAIRRAQETVKSEITRAQADIADNEERIRGLLEQIEKARGLAIQAALEEAQPISGELKDINERITAANDVLKRMEVTAPVRGVVVKLNYNTTGGVIKPGNDIMTLLPVGEELVIQANIRPQDIESLSRGQSAMVRLTALNQRTTPMVPGKLVYVSADAIPSERRQTDNAYIARVRLDLSELADLSKFLPTPGMPAEVFIRTGERTFFQYLMQPVLDTMARAFREA
jgi:HlyD family secretion protein